MKVLYKQSNSESNKTENCFSLLGIKDCYLKQLISASDEKNVTKKAHHHNAYEVHIITEGHQIYLAGDEQFRVDKGDFLIIEPDVQHRIIHSSPYSAKYSVTFVCDERSNIRTVKSYCGAIDSRVMENIEFVVSEINNRTEISQRLIENRVFETVVLLLRSSGYKESGDEYDTQRENLHLNLAKQYIQDNIKEALKISDVAAYCHISNKQLTRIFEHFENMSPALYIRKQKIKVIEQMLLAGGVSLKELSEEFNFSSEYYFNAFFKKHTGMSPGEYKKMHKDEKIGL